DCAPDTAWTPIARDRPIAMGARASRGLWLALILALAVVGVPSGASSAAASRDRDYWVGTWATAPQPSIPGHPQIFSNQSLRLIVHVSAGGTRVRVKISNIFGDEPLLIGAAHIAHRTTGADIDPASDRPLTFRGTLSTTAPKRSMVVSDPVDLETPALSDLAVSLFFPNRTSATTSHNLALQTNYISSDVGDSTAAV